MIELRSSQVALYRAPLSKVCWLNIQIIKRLLNLNRLINPTFRSKVMNKTPNMIFQDS
jgi:hypothetical protein